MEVIERAKDLCLALGLQNITPVPLDRVCMHLGITRAKSMIDMGDVLMDDRADPRTWATAYRKIYGYTLSECRVDQYRAQLLEDIGRFMDEYAPE